MTEAETWRRAASLIFFLATTGILWFIAMTIILYFLAYCPSGVCPP